MRQRRRRRCPAGAARTSAGGIGARQPVGCRGGSARRDTSARVVDPVQPRAAAAPAPRASAWPTWPAPNSSTGGQAGTLTRLGRLERGELAAASARASASVHVPAAALADRRARAARRASSCAARRRAASCARARSPSHSSRPPPIVPSTALAVTSMAAPASRGVEPWRAVDPHQHDGSARLPRAACAARRPTPRFIAPPAPAGASIAGQHALRRRRRIEPRADAVVGDAGDRRRRARGGPRSPA